MKGSWRTTAAGVAGLLASAGTALSTMTGQKPWVTSLGLLLMGIAGLARGILSRDNGVSDEQAGAGQVVR